MPGFKANQASVTLLTRFLCLSRALVNAHQSFIFVIHNVVGYLLMLAVMIYNVHLLLAVVFGTMLGKWPL